MISSSSYLIYSTTTPHGYDHRRPWLSFNLIQPDGKPNRTFTHRLLERSHFPSTWRVGASRQGAGWPPSLSTPYGPVVACRGSDLGCRGRRAMPPCRSVGSPSPPAWRDPW